MKRAAVAVAVALVLLLVYGVAVEPRLVLDEREITAELPGLDASWEGEQVAVFSDLQTGMWLANTGMVERVVDRVVEVDPAAVLLVGDFVYSKSPEVPEQVRDVVELLRPIPAAGIPTFAVLGNHDYAVGAADELTAALQELGVEVLRNDAVAVPSDAAAGGEPLYVVGVGPTRPDLVDVDAALAGVPDTAARITMLHNPTSFPRLPAGSAPLAVAGHTHCVQIALPGLPRWSYLGLTEEEAVVADGYAPADYGADGNELFVTCGIGFSLVPVRINAPPQLLLVELERPD
ncbi:metallophosphoesterase [soil metagenome]